MIRIAIVENSSEDVWLLESYITQYQNEKKRVIDVKVFKNALIFLNDYRAEFDIVFMDIDMPMMDGIDAANALRKMDTKVVLVFITNLAQLAIKGYAVNAFDFVAKPVQYLDFSTLLTRAINKAGYERKNEITIVTTGKIVKLDILSISYIEVSNHKLLFHTDQGDFESWGSLKKIEQEYAKFSFVKISSNCLVNLRRIVAQEGSSLKLHRGEVVYVSRSQKKEFTKRFLSFTFGEE